jgi:hypothetical protein
MTKFDKSRKIRCSNFGSFKMKIKIAESMKET